MAASPLPDNLTVVAADAADMSRAICPTGNGLCCGIVFIAGSSQIITKSCDPAADGTFKSDPRWQRRSHVRDYILSSEITLRIVVGRLSQCLKKSPQPTDDDQIFKSNPLDHISQEPRSPIDHS
jgi:hypothetical protein